MMKRNRGVIDVAILLIAAVAFGCLMLHQWAYNKGFSAAERVAERNSAAQQQADAAERGRQTRAAEESKDRLRGEANQLSNQLKEAKDHAKTLQNERDRALRGGDKRLSIRAANCVPAVVPVDSAAQPGAARPEEARAELVGEDGAEILAITDAGDEAIRDLNFCIDRYSGAAAEIERYKRALRGELHVEAAEFAKHH